MPEYTANSSLSKAEYICWAGSNFLEKKPSGLHAVEPISCCCNTAPTWEAEASSARLNCTPTVGCARQVACRRASLAEEKAASQSGVHATLVLPLGPPRKESVRGRSVLAMDGRNRR
jgi:hypothetical protein